MDIAEIRRMASLESRHWWFVGSRTVLLSMLWKHASPGGRLLDVGCGTGYTLSRIRDAMERGTGGEYDLFGLDLSPEALAFSGEKVAAQFVRGDVGCLPFKGSSFDVVTALDVLEHLESDREAVSEIARVLRPGGLALLSVPAHPWMFSTHDRALGHVRRYSASAFRELLLASELSLERLSHYNCLLAAPIMLYRLARKAFGAGSETVESDLSLPSAPVNRTLQALLSAESKVLPGISLPLGVSLVAVARKME